MSDPIRVIYAKLTSTGSYDVVAMTSSITLERARATAERLRLGDVPSDASFSAAVAYLRPSDGGHLIARFTPYPWRDADGREPLMTDLVWVDDEDFARVRGNAFALVPTNERTFATLETLEPIPLPAVSAEAELQRIAELGRRARNFTTFAAAVLSTERLLVLDAEPADHIELLTLLLPPRLRGRLTFQTRAYDVPAPVPRVTASDRFRATLQRGNWQRVLPDDAELPPTVASRLADFIDAPQALFRAHELYARVTTIGDSLASEAARLVRLADFGEMLDKSLVMEAVRLIAKAESAEAQVEIAELEARLNEKQIADVLTALLETDGSDAAVAQFIEHARAANAQGLPVWTAVLAEAVNTRPRSPEPNLIVLLIAELARSGDADRVLSLVSRFRRLLAGAVFPMSADTAPALSAYLDAQLGRGRMRAVGAAARVVNAVAGVHALARSATTQRQLADTTAEAIHAALEALTLTSDDVSALRELQTAVDALPNTLPWSYDLSMQLLTARFLEYARNDSEIDAAVKKLDGSLTSEALAAFAAGLIVSATRKGAVADRSARAARTALQLLKTSPLPQRIPVVIEQLGVTQLTLWELPGLEDVMPMLDSARAAGDTRKLAVALNRLQNDPAAIGDVAAATLQLRTAGARLTNDWKPLSSIAAALTAAARNAAALELALELVATIADPAAMRTLENVVLEGPAGAALRLRRLDRAVLQCQGACDEPVYDELVRQLEQKTSDLPDDAKQRLRQALGVKTLQYRVSKGIENVLSRREA